MRFFPLIILMLAGLVAYPQKDKFRVIAYYSGPAEKIDQFDVSNLTHIIHSFSHLKGNQLDMGREQKVEALKKLVALKQTNPKLKVLLSLGGWTGCFTCSEVFSDAGNRAAFAVSVKEALEKYDADGIDLDWEYPAIPGPPGHPFKPEDRENFTALVRVLRETLPEKYSISFAAGGFDKYFEEAIEWDTIAKMVDFINLMSYDLVGGYSTVTGHHTPLYSTPENRSSVDAGVKQMMARGVPAEKIVIGLAFYGRVWENVADINNGLYQSGKFKNSQSIVAIDKLKTDEDYQFLWDDTAQAPYIHNKKLGLFYTFDDRKSVKLKTLYALEHQLGGVMFWELSLDYPQDGLLAEIIKTVHQHK